MLYYDISVFDIFIGRIKMEQKCKACWNCWNFKAYYTKGWCHFDKDPNGYCLKHKKITDKHEVCEAWYTNETHRERRKKVALRKLKELANDLTEIRQILLEDKEDSENDFV